MTLKEVGIIVLAGVLLYGGYSWQQEREARLVAQQRDADTQAEVQKLQEAQAAADKILQESLAKQQAQFDDQMKTLQGQMAYLQNTVASLNKLGQLQTPIIVTPPTTPGGDTTVQIPQVDLQPLDAAIQALQVKAQQLPVVQGDLNVCQASLKSVQADNVQLKTALKGGTFFQRVGKALKNVGIGVGIGIGISRFI